jgi:hypothetical protein
MKNKERQALQEAIESHLDTRDKRFMFLKISFPELLPQINIEGSPRDTSWRFFDLFQRQQMTGSLMAHMNSVFNLDLTITYK